ncbi:MAG: hypothetical protein ACQEUZ_00465 [Pseudomonadota bacterium]
MAPADGSDPSPRSLPHGTEAALHAAFLHEAERRRAAGLVLWEGEWVAPQARARLRRRRRWLLALRWVELLGLWAAIAGAGLLSARLAAMLA